MRFPLPFEQFPLQLHYLIRQLAAEDMRDNPLLHELTASLLHPAAGKVMDAIGVLRQFEHTRAG